MTNTSVIKKVTMIYKHFLLVGASLFLFCVVVAAQDGGHIPITRFTCRGRPSGYYADVETGCQVYHMCDGLGRQFSYSCPNTTLFQQRMLICDHWYMVNCSKSEGDYDANLLIGQRDKPFVSEEDMKQRTPRPDILSVPPNSNYFEGLKEAESKFPVHPGNSIVGIADTVSSANNNGLDGDKNRYRPPTSWSTGIGIHHQNNNHGINLSPNYPQYTHNHDTIVKRTSTESPEKPITRAQDSTVTVPTTFAPISADLVPPPLPSTTAASTSDEYSFDIRMKSPSEDPVFKFIKRFDPNSPDSIKTAMTKTEIENLNKQLPQGQSSAEDERTPRYNKNAGNNFNTLHDKTSKKSNEGNKFGAVTKSTTTEATTLPEITSTTAFPTPAINLLPPKREYSPVDITSTTVGPSIYYEWKWAVPALELELPKVGNVTNQTDTSQKSGVTGRSPFRDVTRPTTTESYVTEAYVSNVDYNISSYFVPDYVFPLDKPHPGYENDDAQTSFEVKIQRSGRSSYGENPACPQCHPAYLIPGTCEPCIINR